MSPAMTSAAPAPLRLLFVHAHPDDETLATGVALAHHAAAGDRVHVLTCTLGEEGEVIPPELAHLEGSAGLAPYRAGELNRALAVLGVQHQLLGAGSGVGVAGARPRWRDSGMAGTPGAEHPRAFCRAGVGSGRDADGPVRLVADRIQAIDADVVVTYDAQGGYAHPDHIQAHRVTVAAVRSLPPADRPALYAVLTPRSWARADRAWLARHVDPAHGLRLLSEQDPYPPSVVDDVVVTHELVDPGAGRLQLRAVAEHRTQVTVHDADPADGTGGYFALSNGVAARLAGREGYARLDPDTGAVVGGSAGAGTRHTGLQGGPG